MNRQQAIEAIKQGTHVLDIDGYQETKEAIDMLNDIEGVGWLAKSRFYGLKSRFYGLKSRGEFNRLNSYEINGRPIIKLSDILDETETAIPETKNMMEYDEKLIEDWDDFWIKIGCYMRIKQEAINKFMDQRYPDKELE